MVIRHSPGLDRFEYQKKCTEVLRKILLYVSENDFLKSKLPQMKFVKSARSRFMPGETLQEALEAAVDLQQKGAMSVFTLLGESVEDATEAEGVVGHYQQVLLEITNRRLTSEISLKLTQIGVDIDRRLASSNLNIILECAERLGLFVWIDIEGSQYTDITTEIYEEAVANHPNVGLCLQAYLYRTDSDIDRILSLHPAIRLVKGAYLESPEIAFPTKTAVDRNYLKLADKLLSVQARGEARIVFATHDNQIIASIIESLELHKGLSVTDVEFHMLYGVSRSIQTSLLEEGSQVGVLIAYGSAWFPWYMRRLAERPANLWFVLRKVFSN